MTQTRSDGVCLLLLGCIVFLLFGFTLEQTSPITMVDFGVVYFPARCLLQHGDPYKESDVLRVYLAEGGEHLWNSEKDRKSVTRDEYPPSAFCLIAPFALLPWMPAHLLWIAVTAAGLILSAFLAWDLCADTAPVFAAALIGFALANCEVAIVLGNPAGIVICCCIVAVWCLLRERFVPLGVTCLALSLVVKPHDSGMIWLYFLLAGGVYRKRALQALGIAAAVSLPAILWVWRVSPNWMQELHANIASFAAYGGSTDPGPASIGSHGLGMLVNLQTVFSLLRDNPAFYNPASFAIAGSLLLVWVWAILRSRPTPQRACLALASGAALTMLPLYHHLYDTKLLLLAVPACVVLGAQSKRMGRLAMVVTLLCLVLTADLVWAAILMAINGLPGLAARLGGNAITAIQVVPAPLAILLLGVFYLYAFIRQPGEENAAA
jgi:hypothetical protein